MIGLALQGIYPLDREMAGISCKEPSSVKIGGEGLLVGTWWIKFGQLVSFRLNDAVVGVVRGTAFAHRYCTMSMTTAVT